MAILQALISLITRSAGKAVNAIFGWAVLALFGSTSPREQTLLSGVVALAVAWPILVLGAIFPRIALFILAFVPAVKSIPSLPIRLVWIGLAIAVPFIVGGVIAKRSPPEAVPEKGVRRVLRGFQVTLALAVAFLMMMVISPVQKIGNAIKGRKLIHIPAVMDKRLAPEAMATIADRLADNDIEVHRNPPPWHMTAPSKVLLKIGGTPFARMATEDPEYRRGEQLQVAVLPNETQLIGKPHAVARGQALISEIYGPRPVLQTFNAQAQSLEKQIKRVWAVLSERPRRHRDSGPLRMRIEEISHDLARADDVPWDEWQLVYRLILQLDRALRGQPPLITNPKEENQMANQPDRLALPGAANLTPVAPGALERSPALESLSNRELIQHVVQNATMLAKKEIELAKTELKADIKRETAMAKGLGVGALCALFTVNLMLVACALALGTVIAEWAAALIVAAVVLAIGTIAGLVGWGKRVKSPLEATRRSVKEDVTWAKERLA